MTTSGIRIEFSFRGAFDSFTIYRSLEPISVDNLPSPHVTNLRSMFYHDTMVVTGTAYYYRIEAHLGNESTISNNMVCIAGLNYEDYMISLEPIHYWKMNELSGNVIRDYGADPVDGALSGAISYTEPPIRSGQEHTMGFGITGASASRVIVPATPSIYNLTKSSFTFCVWFKQTALTTFNYVFADFINASSGTVNMRLQAHAFQFPQNTRSFTFRGSVVDETVFVAVRYSVEEKKYEFFVNGEWKTGNYVVPPTVTSAVNFMFPGAASYGHYPIRGMMSDLTLFDRALSTTEIELIYSLGVQ